ncbi:MAG: hypothetical protein IPI68_12815 [Chitinophagaceae bacterium]|nr:hypothetical protein [Chitinophagaceae bacterium]
MSLIDAKYYPNGRFFWDQRAATLEDQTLAPTGPCRNGNDLAAIRNKT